MGSATAGYDGPLLRQRLVLHARVLQHVRPLATGAGVTVLEVLAEVVGAEELLGFVALAELVDVVEVLRALVPARRVLELLAAVAADVCTAAGYRLMEGGFWAGEGGA